jgi:RNA polymerase sigma-70 factor (ECF subfamily)
MNERSENSLREMELLFKEQYALLCMVSFGIVKDKDASKDIVQDFFISYWQRKETILVTVSFKAYAIKAVKNLSFLYLEKAKKNKALLNNLNIEIFEEQQVFDKPKDFSKIQELIDRLPESRRNIFISFVVQGMSYAEIAENYDITINTVKTQMKRAYAFLRAEATEDMLYFFIIASFLSFIF